MADYFAALAARTLRPELSVQPRQRVRWEEASEPEAAVFPSPQRQAAAERPIVLDAEPPRRVRGNAYELAGTTANERAVLPTARRRGKRTAGAEHEEMTAATVSGPHPTVRAIEPPMQVRFERVVTRSHGAPGTSSASARERVATATRASNIDRAGPLSTRRVAPERPAEPAIRIHIGRVDVRAVTSVVPGSSPSASRDSKRALMSLDEYVQKRDRGAS
jgi:hypothetical protein